MGAVAGASALAALVFVPAGRADAVSTRLTMRPSGGTPIMTDVNCGVSSDFATPANDTVGQPGDCAQAGYIASGRDFKYAHAVVTVPDYNGFVGSSPTTYVALDGSGAGSFNYARVGVEPCVSTGVGASCPGDISRWQAFASVAEGTGSPVTTTWPVTRGSGISVSVSYNATGGSDTFDVTMPDGTMENTTLAAPGADYTRAEALTDWEPAEEFEGRPILECRFLIAGPLRHTTRVGSLRNTPPVGHTPCRTDQFFEGQFTTASGAQGTFQGPWTLNPVEASSNGAPAGSGTLLSAPSYLWDDHFLPHAPAGDAFGVWIYQQTVVICTSVRRPAGRGPASDRARFIC